MNVNNLIILYSKYSNTCNEILKKYNNNTMKHIHMLCIDNSKLREKVLKSNKYSITTVPCVLLVYDTKIEKFEGDGVVDWILTHMDECNVAPSSQTSQVSSQVSPSTLQPDTSIQGMPSNVISTPS